MSERKQLERAIAALEAQRSALGDAVVEAGLAPLREKLAALERAEVGGHSLAGERKLVTVMFADISGFTPLSETLDPEAVRDLINACFEQLVPMVEKYEGTVDKFMGDNIMALFGAPVAHENDPERALRAALDMMEALAEFNAKQGVELGLHFGINTGLVIAGGLGTQRRQAYSVVGDAVNLAARLEDLSERGEILVGPDTHRLTAPLFEYEALEPVQVKGKAEPVPVYRLLGLKAEPQWVRGLEGRGIHSPLVGRDAEVEAIQGCLERLLVGQGGILSIIGEAGVGKSRLMAEIRDQTLAKVGEPSQGWSSPQWLEGRTLSFGQTISYWPFQEILWQYAGISEKDSKETAWDKLETRIHSLFGAETPEILPYLASLLSLEVREAYAGRVKYLDGEAMGRQVLFTSRRFFERLAQAQPLVLVIEDLHWADESSALLLEHLLPLVERAPLLICGLSRPYRQAPAARLQAVGSQEFEDRYTELQLAPLSAADSAQLVRNLLAIEGLPDRSRERIVSKAGGNPFFLEEIIRTLIDAGAIRHDPATGRWQATAQVEAIAIPDTVQGVIMARVDRLDEEVKGALRTASVVGRSFLYRVLRAVAKADRRLDQHLAELQVVELIREKQRLPELEYMFRHALAQEATYESILLQVRRELHARVGRAIETLFADRMDEFYSLLAYHYARAEAWEEAQEYLLKAGDQAGRVAADAEALAHYKRAMAAYGQAFGEAWDPLQRAALERKMGEALFRRGEHEAALDHFHRALAYLGSPVPTTHWGVRLATMGEILQQAGHRLLPGLFLRSRDGPIGRQAAEEAVRCYEPLCWIEVMTVPERFFLIALKGFNVSEASGLRYGTVVGSTALGLVADFFGLFRLASIYHHQALVQAEEMQHLGALSLAHTGLAGHKLNLAELDVSNEHARQAAGICRETGDLHNLGWVFNSLAYTTLIQGRLSQALVICQKVIRIGQEGADPQVQCWGFSTQGAVQLSRGQLSEAIRALQETLALAEAIPDYGAHVAASACLGQCYARQGKLEQALSALRTSQQVYAEHAAGWGIARPLFNGLAEVYSLAAEQHTTAKDATWLMRAKAACSEAVKKARRHRHGLPEALMLQGRYEWLRGRPRAANKWWQQALALAEAQGQRYDLGVIHLEMGRRLGDRAHLERAEAILAEVGAEWNLARAREALDGM